MEKKNGHPSPNQLRRDLEWVENYIQRLEKYLELIRMAYNHARTMQDPGAITYSGRLLEKYQEKKRHAEEYERITKEILR